MDYVIRACDLHVELPATAIGKGYRGPVIGMSVTPGGTGVQPYSTARASTRPAPAARRSGSARATAGTRSQMPTSRARRCITVGPAPLYRVERAPVDDLLTLTGELGVTDTTTCTVQILQDTWSLTCSSGTETCSGDANRLPT